MNDDRITRLTVLRDELAEIKIPNYPNAYWSLVNSWIAKATPIIRRDWNEFLDDFQKIAVEPNKTRIVYHNSDFSLSEQEHRRQWEIDNSETEEVRQNILGFLNGLLILPKSPGFQKKKSLSKSRKTKSPVEVLVAKYGLAAAIFGVLGTCITAYFSYISTRTEVELPIFATQTAEARLIELATNIVSPSSNPPTSILSHTSTTPSLTISSTEACVASYPNPIFYSCFDGTGPTAGSFELKDGHLYSNFVNSTDIFTGGGLYPIAVSQQAKYIEFNFSILNGTEGGILALRSYCSAGGGFFLQFYGDGNWNGHYDDGSGDKNYNGGTFSLKDEHKVKISQKDSGVEISINDVPLNSLLPCDQVGLKIELFVAASGADFIEGYFDNFGAWATLPNNP